MMVAETDRLVEDNMGLVAMVVRRYVAKGVEYEDLMQIGSIGLIKAAKCFDKERNLKFSTYAVSKIIGEIKTFLRDNGSVKVSRVLRERLNKVLRLKEQLMRTLEREPTVSEIATELSLSVEEVTECLEIKDLVLSLDAEPNGACALFEMLGVDPWEENLVRINIHQALERLEANERKLIVLRYFLDLTQSETASRLDISQVSVSRQEKNILKKLAKMIS